MIEFQAALLDWVRTNAKGKGKRSIYAFTDLLEEEVLDSLGIVLLISFTEELLGNELPEETLDLRNFRSVDSIVSTYF